VLHVKVGVAACEDGTARAQLHVAHGVARLGGATDDTLRRLGRDDVSDVADALIVEVEVAEVRLARVDEDAQQLEDRLVALALGQGAHRGLHQVELLLQVVETDLCVDSVPIQHFVIEESRRAQSAVDVLLVEDIEKGLEKGCAQQEKQD